jgi:uncharacterized membrane protein
MYPESTSGPMAIVFRVISRKHIQDFDFFPSLAISRHISHAAVAICRSSSYSLARGWIVLAAVAICRCGGSSLALVGSSSPLTAQAFLIFAWLGKLR